MKQQIRHLTLREESARNELHECRKALEVTKASYEEKLCQAHRDVLQADAKLQEVGTLTQMHHKWHTLSVIVAYKIHLFIYLIGKTPHNFLFNHFY